VDSLVSEGRKVVTVLDLDSALLLVDIGLAMEDLREVAGATTVVDEQVRGVRGDVRQRILGGDRDHVLLELSGLELAEVARVRLGLQGKEVGQETGNVGRSHRGTRDGVDGVLAANPGGLNVQARGEDISALSVVGEVGTLVTKGGGTNGDSLLGRGRRVVARVGVVVTGSNSEVDTNLNGSVDSHVERGGLVIISNRSKAKMGGNIYLATTQRHVRSRALEVGVFLRGLLDVRLGSPFDTLHDIGHGTRAIGAKDLDGIDVGLLRNTVLLATDSSGTVSSVSVSILIGIAGGDGLAPVSTSLEVDVLDVRAGVNNVDVDTLTTVRLVDVLVEVAKVKALLVGNTGQTPRSRVLDNGILKGVDNGVLLDIRDLKVMLTPRKAIVTWVVVHHTHDKQLSGRYLRRGVSGSR
jgi:hypothetical protein